MTESFADVLSGVIGGRIGFGFRTPSYPGGVARYLGARSRPVPR